MSSGCPSESQIMPGPPFRGSWICEIKIIPQLSQKYGLSESQQVFLMFHICYILSAKEMTYNM